MPVSPALRKLSRRDPASARAIRAWRRLTTPDGAPRAGPGGRTLVACSAGADSSALVLVLGAAGADVVVAHVVHDMRPPEESLPDRDAARALAEACGYPFVEARIRVRDGRGNIEAGSRRARYAALAHLATAHACPFVATGHQAGDQLESLLMAIARGSGPRGLAGVAPRRPIVPGHAVQLIRPMLQLTPDETRRLCRDAGWAWREDRTNADTTRLRSALRAFVLPPLLRLRPGAARGAVAAGALLADAAGVVREASERLERSAHVAEGERAGDLDRVVLRGAPAVVLGEVLARRVRACGSSRRRDRLTASTLAPAIRAIRDRSGARRTFRVGDVTIDVSRHAVRVSGGGHG